MSKMLARFYVASISHNAYNSNPDATATVTLQASTKGEENKTWAKYTPAGTLNMTVNGNAVAWFHDRLGKDLGLTLEDLE